MDKISADRQKKFWLGVSVFIIINIMFYLLLFNIVYAGNPYQEKDYNILPQAGQGEGWQTPNQANTDSKALEQRTSSSGIIKIRRERIPLFNSSGRIGYTEVIYLFDDHGRLIRQKNIQVINGGGKRITDEVDETWSYNDEGRASVYTFTLRTRGKDEDGKSINRYFREKEDRQFNDKGRLIAHTISRILKDFTGELNLKQIVDEALTLNDKDLVATRRATTKTKGTDKDGKSIDEYISSSENNEYDASNKLAKQNANKIIKSDKLNLTQDGEKTFTYNDRGLLSGQNSNVQTKGTDKDGNPVDDLNTIAETDQYDSKDRITKQNITQHVKEGKADLKQDIEKTSTYNDAGISTNENYTIHTSGTDKNGKAIDEVATSKKFKGTAGAGQDQNMMDVISRFLDLSKVNQEELSIAKITKEDKITGKIDARLETVEDGSVTLDVIYEDKDMTRIRNAFRYNYGDFNGSKLIKSVETYDASGKLQKKEGYEYDEQARLTVTYEQDGAGNKTITNANKYDAEGVTAYTRDGNIYRYDTSGQLKAVITPNQDVFLPDETGKFNTVVTARGEVYKLNESGQMQYMFNGSRLDVLENGSIGQDTGREIARWNWGGNWTTLATGRFYTGINLNTNQATENQYVIQHRYGYFGYSSSFDTKSNGTVSLPGEAAEFAGKYKNFINQAQQSKQAALGTAEIGLALNELPRVWIGSRKGSTIGNYTYPKRTATGWQYDNYGGGTIVYLGPGQTIEDWVANKQVELLGNMGFDRSKDYLILSSADAKRLGEKLTGAGIRYFVRGDVEAVKSNPETLYLLAQQGPRPAGRTLSGYITAPRPPLSIDDVDKNGNIVIRDMYATIGSDGKRSSNRLIYLGAGEALRGGGGALNLPTGIATLSDTGDFTIKGDTNFSPSPEVFDIKTGERVSTSFSIAVDIAKYGNIRYASPADSIYYAAPTTDYSTNSVYAPQTATLGDYIDNPTTEELNKEWQNKAARIEQPSIYKDIKIEPIRIEKGAQKRPVRDNTYYLRR